jgi:hypothetical protein
MLAGCLGFSDMLKLSFRKMLTFGDGAPPEVNHEFHSSLNLKQRGESLCETLPHKKGRRSGAF